MLLCSAGSLIKVALLRTSLLKGHNLQILIPYCPVDILISFSVVVAVIAKYFAKYPVI
jgi:hypothetical protein